MGRIDEMRDAELFQREGLITDIHYLRTVFAYHGALVFCSLYDLLQYDIFPVVRKSVHYSFSERGRHLQEPSAQCCIDADNLLFSHEPVYARLNV